jgi:hypothetical protein
LAIPKIVDLNGTAAPFVHGQPTDAELEAGMPASP